MLNNRLRLIALRSSKSWLKTQSSRLGSAFGIAAILPETVSAGRREERRDDQDQNRNDSETNGDRTERREANQNDESSNDDKNGKAKTENQDAQNEEQSSEENQNSNRHSKSDTETSRKEAKNEESTDSESSSRKDDDESANGRERGDRRSETFEQEADDVPAADEPAPTPVVPSNPNVTITDITDISEEVSLVVEANPDVIASVSARGGFAFARSGDVTAVTGPDGASIIQGEPTTTPEPTEPSDDGGNNDLDFSS